MPDNDEQQGPPLTEEQIELVEQIVRHVLAQAGAQEDLTPQNRMAQAYAKPAA